MSDKNAVALLYEYCQNKNTTISISDLNFEYDINNSGLFNCKVTLNGEVFDQKLACKSKKAAKNQIAQYVYEELKRKDNAGGGFNNKDTDNRNAIVKLNEYCQDKNTKINLSDLIFDYEINKDGNFNCKVTINGKVYDKKLNCKSKKAAKNEIAEYVYECLVGGNKSNTDIFNEEIYEQLKLNHLSRDDVKSELQVCDNEKYMCIVEFTSLTKEAFLILEPLKRDEISNKFLQFLREPPFNTKEEKKEKEEKDLSTYKLKDYSNENEIPYKYIIETRKDSVKVTYYSLGIVIGEKKENISDEDILQAKKRTKKIGRK